MTIKEGRRWRASWALAAALICAAAASVKAASCSGGVANVPSISSPSIQDVINNLQGATLSGDYCIAISSNAQYFEPSQVTINNINTNGFRLIITSGTYPVDMSLQNTLDTAVFDIQNASVTISGVTIALASLPALTDGVLISSPNVVISDVVINDSSGVISGADVLLQGAVSNTLSGLSVFGNSNAPALYLTGASSGNIVANSFISNSYSGNAGAQIDGGSTFNTISFSTVTGLQGNNCTTGALVIKNASNNMLSGDYVSDSNGNGLYLNGGANSNTVQGSTVTTGGGLCGGYAVAVYIGGSSSNNISNSYMSATATDFAMYFDAGANNNTVSQSTMTADVSGGFGIQFSNTDTFNTVTHSYISAANPAKGGVTFSCDGSNDTVSFSTVVYSGPNTTLDSGDASTTISNDWIANGGTGPAITLNPCGTYPPASNSTVSATTATSNGLGLGIYGVAGVSVTNSYIQGSTAAVISASTGTMISGSTLQGSSPSPSVYVTAQSSGIALSNDAVQGGLSGIDLDAGNAGVLGFSSVAVSGSAFGLDIAVQAPTAVLSIDSMTFAALTPGATAINFNSAVGVFDSTFSGVDFADTSIGANINASLLTAASSLVMRDDSGARTGPQYADDPGGVIQWASLPTSAATAPVNGSFINSLAAISGTAASPTSTIASVSIAIEQLSTGTWWNGSVWTASQTWIAASFVGADSGTWSWPVGALNSALQSGASYKIVSRAADSVGQTQYPAANSNFIFDNTPPTSWIGVPGNGSQVPALPSISGTAADGVGVAIAAVSLNIQDLSISVPTDCYNQVSNSFNAACPNFFSASISSGIWSYGGIVWAAGHQYLIVSSATDAAGNAQNSFPVGASSNTFTFNGLAVGNPGDGQGAATISPASAPGCQVLTATISFVVGGTVGLQQGGMIAVNIPPGWSSLQGEDSANDPPLNAGYVHVVSSVSYGMQFNPSQIGNTFLGANWMVYTASAALNVGDTVQFVYEGHPTAGLAAQGPQVFAVQVQGGPGGNLKPIAGALPSISLAPGPAANLAFVPNNPLALGPLQSSPTMYLAVTDACGVSTTAASAVTATLSGSVNGAPDSSAIFFPGSQVTIPQGASQSSGFSFETSTSAAYENLSASATVMGTGAYAYRPVQLLASSAAISGVSVDTGTLGSSLNAVITQNSPAGGTAFINFSLSNSALGWEVVISSNPASFSPKAADFFGSGNPGRTLVWNGLNDMVYPNSFVSSGTYYVEIIAGGGAAVNTALSISVSAGASIFGTVSNGAGASVSVMGPNIGPGNFAAADANGNFVIPGLQTGGIYNVQVSSTLLVSGAPVNIATGTSNIAATSAGTNIGSLTLPVPSYIAVSASLSQAAPSEIWGGVSAHDASYSNTASAVLHFAQGSAQSDNGAQSFGVAASTWTQLFLPPGSYEVDVNLPSINVSTRVLNVNLSSGSIVELPLALSKQANVYGYAILPTAASTGTQISVQAALTGASNGQGGVYGGVFVPSGSSSGVYSLFGLAPGSWTVTAQSRGYVGVSSEVFISSDADVGASTTGGFDLTLQTCGVISGTMTVTGDSSQESASSTCAAAGSGFCVQINAYGPAAISGQGISVHLATSTTQTSSTFTISGLPDGAYFLKSSLPGFVGGVQNAVVAGGSGSASLVMNPANDGLAVTLVVPGGGFGNVSLGYNDNLGDAKSFDDITQISGFTSSGATATVVFPALNPSLYTIDAFDKADGIFREVPAAISAATTTAVNLNMSGAAYSVRGSLSFSGALNVPEPGGFSVMVSSAAGWLSQVSTVAYCVMGSSNGVTLSAAQMQLLPAGPNNGGFYGGTLQTPSNCSDMMTGGSNNQGNSNPFHVYLATIGADGTFDFSGIPPGLYQLRNNAQMDSSGDSIPQFSQVVLVTGPVAGISFPVGSGYSISGSVLAPAQTPLSRQIYLRLTDQNNNQVGQQLVVSFNNSASASFLFPQVPPGSYLIQAQDGGYPQAYAAAPLAVTVSGQSLIGQSVQLVPSGTIKFRVAIEQKSSAGVQFMRVTQNNASLLPSSFQIQAVADPWFNGGYGSAQSQGGPLVLDSNGQGTIAGLLPGSYDVNMAFQNGPSVSGAGLVASSISGVKVVGGVVTDVGTINALLGDQISGRVADSNGNPLANINMIARISQRSAGVGSQEISAVTDGNGYYALNGLDPNVRYYDIYAAYRGDQEHQGEFLPPYEQQIESSVDVSSVTTLNFSLARAAYSISGQVLAPAGGPSLIIPFNNGGNKDVQVSQPGAAVFLQKVGVPPTRTPLGDIQLDTDLNGNFSIPSLATGTYRMTVVSQGYSSFQENVLISSAFVNVGSLTLSEGSTLSGTLTTSNGGSPSTSQIQTLVAATQNLSSVLVGTLQTNAQAQTVTGYSVSGFQVGTPYEILLLDSNGNMVAPAEARNIVFSSTAPMTLNIVYRPSPPLVMAKDFRQGNGFDIEFDLSQPLRDETADDDNAGLLLSTVSAQGALSDVAISQDRSEVTAFYVPGVSESSFTLRLQGYSNVANPSSLDQNNPQFVAQSTVTFYVGVGGLSQSNIQNYIGGNILAQGEAGRVTLPADAFNVSVASSVQVTLQLAQETLTSGASPSGISPGAERIESLSHSPASYPAELVAAVAAVPPSVNPLSSFYNIFLPLGVSTLLSSPAQLTVAYSTSVTDPASLNVYWYNALANAYVLQQDVTGSPPVIDAVNHTITINVNHFSTYVLFDSNQSLISGGTGATDFSAHNFPNPFDLTEKTVTPQHAGGSCGSQCTVRGTMIAISIPPGMSGAASIDIYDVVGTKVRHIDLGDVSGGNYYYQNWDGTNDAGRDVASGVYFGELKVGGQKAFFKMAVIKGSGL
ncbi:MAG TPA: FlgD immunoglobulin-like domain containing protein [Elusimicrobiota bacterium]|nr:FlgD immunoglobulin-like domain containing protein [Elusimicrobiota bacterium]